MGRSRVVCAAVALGLMLGSAPAGAADPMSWTGFYLGGHAGAMSGWTGFSDPDGPPIYGGTVMTPGFLAGLQVGYDWQFAPQWLVGLQLAGSVVASQGGNDTCMQSDVTAVGSNCKVKPREIATLTGRLGFLTEPQGRTLLYGKGGLAWMRSLISINPNNAIGGNFPTTGDDPEQGTPTDRSVSALGWTVGAGVEYALTPAWSLNFEYDYLRFGGITLPKPATLDVTNTNNVTVVPGGDPSSISMNQHMARIGLNYRWGGASKPSGDVDTASPPTGWMPGWEVDLGLRYWYSSGRFQTANGVPNVLVSRLTYAEMTGHSGEIFGRLDSPSNVFVKAMFGGGAISKVKMNDEDWGLEGSTFSESFEVTDSAVTGSFSYFTADLGYNVLRGPDHKVGLFVGYNRYQFVLDANGCRQLVNTSSGVCNTNEPRGMPILRETDTWHSLRVGTSVEAKVWRGLKVGADLAYLPYVSVDALDSHLLRSPVDYFAFRGHGQGVQAELILSYDVTEAFSIGIGGRYWAMWTTQANQVDALTNHVNLNTERYGVFLQGAYKFSVR